MVTNRRLVALLLLLVAVGCSVAYAASYNRMPSATFATADTNCGTETGNTCWVTDCNATPACTAGGGANQVPLIRNEGGSWVPMDTLSGTAADTGTTSDTYALDTDGDNLVLSPQVGGLTLDRAAAGTVTLSATDDDSTAALTIDPGGNAALTLGSASDSVVIGATSGVTLENSETISNGTNGTITLGRNDAGVVTITAADNDATAALTVAPGGAAAMVVGTASTTAQTFTTDGTGNAEIVLPDSSLSDDERGGSLMREAIFCGDLPNNNTTYTSPVSGYASGAIYGDGLTATDLSYLLAGTGCAAEDNTTEATADEIMFTGLAAKVHGIYCKVSSSGSNGVTLRVRSATANLTPDVTCTIATGQTECAAATPTTTDIAANATWAVAAVTTEDLSAQDFWCTVSFSLQP